MKAADEGRRLAETAARRRIEEEARRKVEEEARRRAEEEARLRVEIEAQVRAEVEARRQAEEETRRRVEEEARRRAQEEAERLAAEQARRQAEEEARRRAEEETRLRLEEEARLRAEEEARLRAAEQSRLQAEEEVRRKAEAEAHQRAELEARIRAEVEAKIRAEEAQRRETDQADRRRAEHERILAEEAAKAQQLPEYTFEIEPSVSTRSGSDGPANAEFEIERAEAEDPAVESAAPAKVTDIAEWFDVDPNHGDQAAPLSEDHFTPIHDDADGEFHPVSVPESPFEGAGVSSAVLSQLQSSKPTERAAALSELPDIGGEDAFHLINAAFDDQAVEVRSAAARALFDFQEDRAGAFTRALREASPERRRKIGSAIASSGLANEAIRNLTGESRDKTYDAFSLLFLMSKAGEVQPLMRAIEEHPNLEVRLAVVKLLALSGQPDILPAFRRMAVRGSLPSEVRSAVMEAIYQITSQSPAEAQPAM
jgi:hypothetical protein